MSPPRSSSVPDPALIRQVAVHHRTQLLARAREMADDPHFVAGLSWQLFALDRVIRACDGVTDFGELGLGTPSEPVVVEQDDLFSSLGSA